VPLITRIQVYHDKTYNWWIAPPPTAWFILRAAKKKRRETCNPRVNSQYTGYLTLEMLYEIAKMKQIDWNHPEYPPIETRVRSIAGQARRMGFCILGVDAPDSPVKGMTTSEYEKQSAKYRAEQAKQYDEFKAKEFERAPLIEKLHRPDMSKLSYEQLQEIVKDPQLVQAIHRASHPESRYLRDVKAREQALKLLNAKSWFRDMSAKELRDYFANGKLPALELERQKAGFEADEQTAFWARDTV
jgi:hypothetical protein